MGAITVIAMTAEGWYGALMLLSGGAAYAMVKTAPAMASVIREVGFAFVDVRIKYRRELESIREEIREELVEVRREAVEKAQEVEAEASRKRHDLADRLQEQLLARDVEIESLKARLGRTDVRDVRAINAVSDSVGIIAAHTDAPVPRPLPHLDTLPGDKP